MRLQSRFSGQEHHLSGQILQTGNIYSNYFTVGQNSLVEILITHCLRYSEGVWENSFVKIREK